MNHLLTFLAATLISSSAFAQIPNAGFETWTTTSGYDVPTSWDNLNAKTASSSTYSCVKGAPGNPGSYYLKLTSKTVSGMGVMPGIAVCGVLDTTTYKPKSGFASTVRPVSLTGNWQYMAYGSDQGHIMILLSKWNTATNMRDTVAFNDYGLPGMVMSWGSFTIPLTYYSGAVPDSAMIVLAASGSTPVNNSYLYADNLAFTGTVPAGVAHVAGATATIAVYPNPASGHVNITYNSAISGNLDITVNDMTGRMITSFQKPISAGVNNLPLNIAGYAKGAYLIKVDNGEETKVQKLIVE